MGAKRLSLFACAFASLSLLPVQAGNYDGKWSVELSTEQGQCGLNYKGMLNVADGRIADAGMFIKTSGAVDPTGRVAIQITRGSDSLSAGGVLKGSTGDGKWNSSSQQCSGRWRAARS
jgi:hypothetical protein